jgi:hypothetical protein
VGIGGQLESSLIQCGTSHDSVDGHIVYSAWYELLPGRAITIRSMAVSPGDRMQASIQLENASVNEWSITLTNTATGKTFHDVFFYNSSKLTAEWIVERPTVNGVLVGLADFGTITLTDCRAYFGSESGGIDSYPSLESVMYSSVVPGVASTQLVEVSEPAQGGSSFAVTYIMQN